MNKLHYLASPYTHKEVEIRKQRAEAVTKAAVDLLHQGVYVFAPISYNEPWERFNLPGTWEFWCEFDKAFIEKCDSVLVLMLDGWDQSVGVRAEIEFAKKIGKPVNYITEEQIRNGDVKDLLLTESSIRLFSSESKL
jgi:nucleoside 2-deoxyribosyltransferase